MTTWKLSLCSLLIPLFFLACKGEEKKAAKTGISAQNLFLEYQVWGDEEREFVTVLLQLRNKSRNGKTVELAAPGFVELDGEVLQPDSSRLSGVFYETQRPLAEFAGKHKITIRDENKDLVSEEFEYTPFTLATPLSQKVKKAGLTLTLKGLNTEDKLRVTMVDTVFSTADINELMPVINGKLQISSEALQDVKEGPVTLLLFKEEERRIENPSVKGGKIAVTYGLKREFDLEK